MDWVAFKDRLPDKDRLILFGNHRFIEVILYCPEHLKILSGKLNYKNITHWCYIECPSIVEWESKWIGENK